MRTFKFYVSVLTASTIAFPATLFAGTKNNMEVLKQSYKEVGVSSNKNRTSFKTAYIKMRPNLPANLRSWVDSHAAQWGNHQMPEMDSQVVKGKHGQDILKLTFKDPTPAKNNVVIEIDPEAETNAIKINGKILPEKAMTSGEEFMKFVNENSNAEAVNTSLLDQSLVPSYESFKKMRAGDRVLYFSHLRLVMEAAQKVMEQNGQSADASDEKVRSIFEALWKEIIGQPAEAAPSDAGSVMVAAQYKACTDMVKAGLIKASIPGGCNSTSGLATLFAQQPTAYKSYLDNAVKTVATERATQAACEETGWTNCNGTTGALYMRNSGQMDKVEKKKSAIIQSVSPLSTSLYTKVEQARSRVAAMESSQSASAAAKAQTTSAKNAQAAREEAVKDECRKAGGGTFCHQYVGARNFMLDKSDRTQAMNARLAALDGQGSATGSSQVVPATRVAEAAAANAVQGKAGGSSAASSTRPMTSTYAVREESSTRQTSKPCIVAGYIGSFNGNSCSKSPFPKDLGVKNEGFLQSYDSNCSSGSTQACNPLIYGLNNGKAFCVGISNKSTASCEQASPLASGDSKANSLRIIKSLLDAKNESIDSIIKDGKIIDKNKFEALKAGLIGDMEKYIGKALDRCQGLTDPNCDSLRKRDQNMKAALNEFDIAVSPPTAPPAGPAGGPISAAKPATAPAPVVDDGQCTGRDGKGKACVDEDIVMATGDTRPAPPVVEEKQAPPPEPQKAPAVRKSFPWGWLLGGAAVLGIAGYLLYKHKKKKKDSSSGATSTVPQPVDPLNPIAVPQAIETPAPVEVGQ